MDWNQAMEPLKKPLRTYLAKKLVEECWSPCKHSDSCKGVCEQCAAEWFVEHMVFGQKEINL